MWFRILPSLWLFLLLQASVAQQEAINVPFDNETVAGSPIEVTGKVSVREMVAGNEVESSWEMDLVAKNVSDKPILLLVGDLDAIGPHSNGGARKVIEYFFGSPIEPGASIPLGGSGAERRSRCCINPLDQGHDPKASFRLLFVQFLDGSTLGDPTLAHDLLASRTATLQALRELARSYAEQGEHGFQTQLKDILDHNSYGVLFMINRTEEEEGTAAAISRVRKLLAVGEEHEATIGKQAKK
jgi:hypothetical protein